MYSTKLYLYIRIGAVYTNYSRNMLYDDGYRDGYAYKSWARWCYWVSAWCIVTSMHVGI